MPEQSDADTGGDDSQNETFSPLVKAYIDQKIEEAQETQDRTHKKKWKNSWRSASPITKGTFIITAAVAVATISYSIIAGFQLAAMRHTNVLTQAALDKATQASLESSKQFQAQLGHFDAGLGRTELLAIHAGEQATAANRIATLTAKQFDQNQRLVESQRASIEVSFLRVLNPITFSDIGGMSEAFSIVFKNSGGLPANLTAVRWKVIFVQWGDDFFKVPGEKQTELCDRPPTEDERRSIITPITIFKDSAMEWQINFGVGKALDSELIKWPPNQSIQTLRIYPVIVGCVDYQSGAMQNAHQTGFIYTLERIGEGGPTMPSLINNGVNVPKENVMVTRYFFSQGKAY